MIIAGFGCRADATGEQVLAALQAALQQAGHGLAEVAALATIPLRASAPGLIAAAAALGVRLMVASEAALAAAARRCLTDSVHARAATGLPSVAEAAALAACGAGARLLGPRIALQTVTCALVRLPEHGVMTPDTNCGDRALPMTASRG